jgi:hypothetical protein
MHHIAQHAAALAATVTASLATLAGADVHVALSGSDDTGTGTPALPWRTIAKAADAAQPGDTVTIHAGVWREIIRPARSGTPAAPIIFQAAPGELVQLSATEAVTGWTLHSGNIYKAPATLPITGYADTGFAANQIFTAGRMLTEARWPNIGINRLVPRLQGGGFSDTTGLTSVITNVPGGDPIPVVPGGLVGATVWGNEWFISRTGTVTAEATTANGQELTATMTASVARGSFWWYMTGRLGLLDEPGEWHYDGTHLYLWPLTPGAPTGIEAKQRVLCADLTGRSYITLRGMRTLGGTITMDAGTAGNRIERMDMRHVSHHVTLPEPPSSVIFPNSDGLTILASRAWDTGVQLRGTGHTVTECTIEGSAGNGVLLEGTGHTVSGNRIGDTNYQSTYAAPVRLNGSGHKVLRNTIWNTGRDAIVADWHTCGYELRDTEIAYNDIANFGTLSSDLGAIYLASALDLSGTRIHHNSIHDPSNYNNSWETAGIYTDNGCFNVTVDRNIVWNFFVAYPAGLKIASQQNKLERVYHNTVINARSYVPTDPQSGAGDVRNNLFVGQTAFTGPGISAPSSAVCGPGLQGRRCRKDHRALRSPSNARTS